MALSVYEVVKGISQAIANKHHGATDENGKYSFSIQPGNYTLVISYLGYATTQIPFAVIAGEVKIIDHTLSSTGGEELKEVVVAASTRKNTENI